jgi:hypothetical protein
MLEPLADKPTAVTLHVLTTEHDLPGLVDIERVIACDGSMTCRCEGCVSERKARVRRGGRDDRFGGMPIKVRAAA